MAFDWSLLANPLQDIGYGLTQGNNIQSSLKAAGQRTAEMAQPRAQAEIMQRQEQERQAAIRQQGQQKNQTVEWLLKNNMPDLAEQFSMGMVDGNGVFAEIRRRRSGPETPDAVTTLKMRAQEAGLVPGTPEYSKFMLAGNGTTINMPGVGSIPAGYRIDYDANNNPVSMSPIPGSPQAMEAAAAVDKGGRRADASATVTDTITSEASKARALISGNTTGIGQTVWGRLPWSQAAELAGHVNSLKAIASSENINAMRQASPTGAAMGNTSDADLRLLADKAGALNPTSPNFATQLDDYERTLLKIVHGSVAGERIYQETRAATPSGGPSSSIDDTLKKYGL